jgi:hypothetical protein
MALRTVPWMLLFWKDVIRKRTKQTHGLLDAQFS